MYTFVDTTENGNSTQIPSEAPKVNGQYLESLVPGYRTLYVKGREMLSSSLSTSIIGSRHGELLNKRRFPSRNITIGYQLLAEDNGAFREAFNKLMDALSLGELELIFEDEPNVYFRAVYESADTVDGGSNAVTGEFTLKCFDPFKYAVIEKQASPASGVIGAVYNGTREAHPKFRVYFDEDCGYVAFFDKDQHILQFGDPNEIDGGTSIIVFRNNMPVDYSYWTLNSGVGATDPTDGTIEAKDGYLHVKSYGSYTTGSTGWHGVCLSRNINAANDWQFTYSQIFCIAQNMVNQVGRFYAYILDEDNKIIAGVQFIKRTSGVSADVNFWVNGNLVRHGSFDCNYNNKRTGLPADAIRTTSIIKTGDTISFDFTGIQASYNANVKAARKVEFWFLNYEGNAVVTYNGLYSAKFIKATTDGWEDIPNTFTKGDVLEIDTSTAEVKLNGLNRPDLGQLGNDWETLTLKNGVNEIAVAHSDFATPQITMSYREVFI